MTKVTLEYRRDAGEMTSTGAVTASDSAYLVCTPFSSLPFREMLKALCAALARFPEDAAFEVFIQRTDRPGFLPYQLDTVTVKLLRTDPVAGIQALEYPSPAPSTTVQRVRDERRPRPPTLIHAGRAVLADAFGDVVYFKVRDNELECPGCGFWGMYAPAGLLSLPERVGTEFKTTFVCPKKCKRRFVVSCAKEWGYVYVDYLLQNTDLQNFFFPRAWNPSRPWVSRETLQKKLEEFIAEKGQLHVR